MELSNDEIRQLLCLKTTDNIADEIADRQTEVIRKAYNYLTNPNLQNNLVYIADEVGLGKTYVALGIAMLLRHHAREPRQHRDMVLVPKSNLQTKWEKEFKSFVNHNYLGNKHYLKPFLYKDGLFRKEKLELKSLDLNNILTIFRISSFSAIKERAKEAIEKCAEWNFLARQIVANQHFNKIDFDDHDALFAYLLNVMTGSIDCLIIDEAHNYKHGLGSSTTEPSLRNRLTARFLGACVDEKLFKRFPFLKNAVHFPLAKKIICLSATPKDRDLFEIKQQLNCFTNQHPLMNANESNIKNILKTFLIRGNLYYQIGDEKVSRHACRHEHRQGNVEKTPDALPLQVSDDFTGAFWQLVQYQSIKHLNAKANPSFEMGMLAGFETYQLDAAKNKSLKSVVGHENKAQLNPEYQETANKETIESEDKAVLEQIMTAYQTTFDELPPHPKQTRLEEAILEQLKRPEKSLIFVRRVHTATELTTRLLRRYEEYMVELLDFKGKYQKFKKISNDLRMEYALRNKKSELESFFKNKFITALYRHGLLPFGLEIHPVKFCFEVYKASAENQCEIDRLMKLSRLHINDYFKIKIKDVLNDYKDNDLNEDSIDEKEELETIDTTYFFNAYFKKGNDGASFPKKMSAEKLFELTEVPSSKNNCFLSQLLNEKSHCKAEYDAWAKKHILPIDMAVLKTILKGIFRHASGRLPAYIAYKTEKTQFVNHLLDLLAKNAPFEYVTEEVKTILRDFDLIVSNNFSHRNLDKIERTFYQLSPVIGRTGYTGNDKSTVAAQFRLPGFPYILVATDIFREGEDLHTYCQNVYHYGIAWNPSDMEQRTGRIDRINSLSYRKLRERGENTFENKIQVFYPYLQQSVEVNQVKKLFSLINEFMEHFNEIDKRRQRDSRVVMSDSVTEMPEPVIPKRGLFEVDDFVY